MTFADYYNFFIAKASTEVESFDMQIKHLNIFMQGGLETMRAVATQNKWLMISQFVIVFLFVIYSVIINA